MEDPARVAATIRKLIEESPNKKILGTQLGVFLQKEHPGFNPPDHNCRNLLGFIRTFAPQVFVADRSGADVVYSFTAEPPNDVNENLSSKTEPEADQQGIEVAAPIWKTYVSPSGPYKLFVHPEEMEFRVLAPHDPPLRTPWKRIPPCPAATHIEIAKAFVATLPDATIKTDFEKTFSGREWWIDFLYAARRFGLDKQWITFRRRRLLTEFRKALAALDIELEKLPASIAQKTGVGVKPEAFRSRTKDDLTRRIAIGVVRRISTEELRDIRLPLGPVIDELQNS